MRFQGNEEFRLEPRGPCASGALLITMVGIICMYYSESNLLAVLFIYLFYCIIFGGWIIGLLLWNLPWVSCVGACKSYSSKNSGLLHQEP